MHVLQVNLFGNVRVRFSDEQKELNMTRVVQNLLAYLILQRKRMLSREVIAGTLWRDYSQEKARSCLNTALWRLRRAVEGNGTPAGTYLRTTHLGEIGFNPDGPFYLDVARFEEVVQGCLTLPFDSIQPEQVNDLEQALELYQGDLLEGNYEDWVTTRREAQRELFLAGAGLLNRLYRAQQQYDRSIACCQRILAADPLREDIHREMMELYASTGQRSLALRQFEALRALLQDELGVPPMEETVQLYQQVMNSTAIHRPADPLPPQPPHQTNGGGSVPYSELCQALDNLQHISHALEEGQHELRNALIALQQILSTNR